MRPVRHQRGVALLEALIATVILALGLLGAVGMQARAFSAIADAGMRAEATMASEKLLGLMTVDQQNMSGYAYSGSGGNASFNSWLSDTRSRIPNAAVTVAVTPAVANPNRSQVDVTISWSRRQGIGSNVHKVTAYIGNSQ